MHNFECFIIIKKGLFIANTICVLIILGILQNEVEK